MPVRAGLSASDVVDQQHERQVVHRGGLEPEVAIEAGRPAVLGVDQHEAHAGVGGDLKRLEQEVLQQRGSQPLALVAAVHGQPAQQHRGHRFGLVARGAPCGLDASDRRGA